MKSSVKTWKHGMLLSCALTCQMTFADVPYTWSPMRFGAGGFITGIDGNGSTLVARTDVYGAFIKKGAIDWKQLITEASTINANVYTPQKGVVDIKIDPSNSQKIYISYDWQFLRSTDGGDTFSSASSAFNDHNTHLTDFRYLNNRIAIDPSPTKSNIIYYGTWDSGLQISTNSGASFVNANTLGTGLPSKAGFICKTTGQMNDAACGTGDREYPGVSAITMDPSSGVDASGRTKTIYAFLMSDDADYLNHCDPASPNYGTCSGGLYKTTTAGANWYRIGVHRWNNTEGRNKPLQYIIQSAIGADGRYYFTGKIDNQVKVYRIDTDNSVHDITPTETATAANMGWYAIATSKNSAGWVILSDAHGRMVQSTNYGEPNTWSAKSATPDGVVSDVPWLDSLFGGYQTVGSIMFDKSNEAKLWVSNGTGVWNTDSSSPSLWTSVNAGIEEVVTNNVIATSSKVLGGIWDWSVVPFSNLDTYSNYPGDFPNHLTGEILTSWDLDNAEASPNFFVSISSSQVDGSNRSGYSTDAGATWNLFSSYPSARGQIAATTEDLFMWLTSYGEGLQYTTNKGATWSPITTVYDYDYSGQGGVGAPLTLDATFWKNVLDWQSATSQKLSGSKGPYSTDSMRFYFHHKTKGVFMSEYNSANNTYFYKCVYPAQWLSGTVDDYSVVKTVPGLSGNLLLSTGSSDDGRLSLSENSGWGFTPMAGISAVTTFGFGKAATGATYPTIYVVGKKDNVKGIWRSINKGQTWERISPTSPLGSRDIITSIDGDKNVFGKVYIGFNGSGFAYGVVQ
jgi:hypothetical protein